MNHRQRFLWWLAVLVVLAVACGSSATAFPPIPTATPIPTVAPAIQIYVEAVKPSFDEARLARAALLAEIAPPGADSDAPGALIWFTRLAEYEQRKINDLGVVEPPAELRQLHDDHLAAASGYQDVVNRIVELLRNADPDFNLDDLASHPELGIAPANSLSGLAKDACIQLERAVEDKGAQADFGCE